MKLLVFAPYGILYRQSSIMYLVANYLSKIGAETTVLQCDGAMRVCRRDFAGGQSGRTLTSCVACAGEQAALAGWASVKTTQLSKFIIADDVVQGSTWIAEVPASDLCRLEFKGESLWSACSGDIEKRFPQIAPEGLRHDEERYVRDLYATYIQAAVASERVLASVQPSITCVASAGDSLSRAFISQAQRTEGDVAIFSFDRGDEGSNNGAVAVESLRGGSRYTTTVAINDVTTMRMDPRSWGPEIMALVHDITTVLGYGPTAVPGV
jgi:hypothetical protein